METRGRVRASCPAPGHELSLALPCGGTRRTGGLGNVPLACGGGSVPVVTTAGGKKKR